MAGIARRKGKKLAVHGGKQGESRRWLWWLLAAALLIFLAYFFHRPVIAWIEAASRVAGRSNTQEEQRRGTIYDRNFAELAVSRQMVSVQSKAREITSVEETAARLSLILEQSREELLKKMREASRAILATGINRSQEEQIDAMAMPGISIIRKPVRSYPLETVAGHIIGYAESDVGLAGAEYAYDRIPLQFADRLREAGIPPGRLPDVMLTLDLKIQELMETLVKTIGGDDRRTRVGAYVLDLEQGQMLAAAQWPSMNPNIYQQYALDDMNPIITEDAPLPGTFRLFFRDAAMLQDNFENGKSILPWSVETAKTSAASGALLWNKLKFTDQTRPDFASQESSGYGEKKEYFCPSLAGQVYGGSPESLSPLRLLTGIGILASGGQALRPFALAAALDPGDRDKDKRLIVDLADTSQPPEAVPEVVAKEAMRLFAAMGEPGLAGASLFHGQIDCQMSGGKNPGLMRHQLYVAVAPEKNPQYVLLVSARKSGSGVAARDEREKTNDTAEIKAILERVLMFVEVGRGLRGYTVSRPDSSGAYSTNRDRWRRTIAASVGKNEAAAPANEQRMPDMTGMSLRRSLRLLNGAPCRIEITGSGDVLKQSPAAGAIIKTGAVCQLILRNPADITIEKIKERNKPENEGATAGVPVKANKSAKAKKDREDRAALLKKIREQIKAEGQNRP